MFALFAPGLPKLLILAVLVCTVIVWLGLRLPKTSLPAVPCKTAGQCKLLLALRRVRLG